MKNEFLFSVFPFINGHDSTLCKLRSSDCDDLNQIFKDNNLNHGPLNYIKTAETAFNLKRYIELGFFDNSNPNQLQGMINIGRFDYKLEAASIEILYKTNASESCVFAINTVKDYLFSMIDLKRIFAVVKRPIDNPEEKPIENILESCGFICEGIMKRATLNDKNEICDLLIYAVLKESDKSEEILQETEVTIEEN